MDPVSHAVIGRAAIAALDRQDGSRFGPGAGAAAIAGALVPDIDFVLMPAGWDIYLRCHQVGTHSIIGACVLGCGVGMLIRGLVRGSRLTTLAAAASLAAVSHLLLDLLSGAAIGLAWPVAGAQLALPLVAMAEPWLIAVFVIGAIAMWKGRTRLRQPALLILFAAGIFLGAKAMLYGRALRAVAGDARTAHSEPRALAARWGSGSEWSVFVRDPDALRVWRVNAATRAITPLFVYPTADASSLVVASRSLDTVRNFLSVHNLAFAVERAQAAGRVEVLWSDVRYCRQEGPGNASIDCALWFGGLFDKDGHALTQVVHVGDWVQERPPSR